MRRRGVCKAADRLTEPMMSVDVDYIFNATMPLSKLAHETNRSLGCSLARSSNDHETWTCEFMGMSLHLQEDHGLVNDGELRFEDYRFLLGTHTAWGSDAIRLFQTEIVAISAYTLHCHLGVTDGVIIYDLQRVVAQYQLVAGVWTDLISGKAVGSPTHLADVRGRLP
jgi:hypothetical protein